LLWSNFTDIKEFFQSYRGDASDLLHCKRWYCHYLNVFLNIWDGRALVLFH
jgi:hypothetical protein